MENRIQFKKGKQKEFLEKCIKNLSSPSLRGLLQFRINTTYNCLKNYYTERRLLPESLLQDLLYLAKINLKKENIKIKNQNWGKSKGGKISKRNKNSFI